MTYSLRLCCWLTLSLVMLAPSLADDGGKPSALNPARRVHPPGIEGSLVIAGGGSLPDGVWEAFAELAGDKSHLVVIPTASDRADDGARSKATTELWRKRGFENVTILHTRDRATANAVEFCAPLREADAVWISGGQQSRLADAYVGTRVEKELKALLVRGGVIGGSSAGAAIQSKLMIAGGNPDPKIRQGLDLLPDGVIDQHFLKRNRKPRLLNALQRHPGRFGIGIDEGTAVVVRGRRIQVVGESTVSILLPARQDREAFDEAFDDRRVLDLTSLRRAARDRQGEPFPPAKPASPKVENGTLMIVGGGGVPADLVERFLMIAGGKDAPIVVIPTASGDPLPPNERYTAMFTRVGATNVRVLRQRALKDVESKEFAEVLTQARGVWFSGGRQWRFMDAYEGTQAEKLFRSVLERGGIIGGSSAGASIQAEYMVRGNPLGNTDMMALGYERGLGFLGGVAIDQHFTQRRRHPDLKRVIRRFPQLLGIGIDESTAIFVQGSVAEVAGKNDVYFLTQGNSEVDSQKVSPGGGYELAERKLLDARGKKPAE